MNFQTSTDQHYATRESHGLSPGSVKLLTALVSVLTFVQIMIEPPAMAQEFGMDQQYNQYIYDSMQGPALNSTADGNTQAYNTQDSAWQDMAYVQGQYAPIGNIQAPIRKSSSGSVSTYKGTKGDWHRGHMKSGQHLPSVQTGLNSFWGGYTRPACMFGGTNGFYNVGGGSMQYPALPPTSTSSVILHTAF